MSRVPKVAYFCMEYGLSADLPIYAGGLGVLAGDILKTAYDTKLPLIGIGILWENGYTTQVISPDNWPEDRPQKVDKKYLTDTGKQIKVTITGHDVHCKIWLCDAFNNAPLYLLEPLDMRGSFESLYCGSEEDRVKQEMVLGIGGVRALKALGIRPDLYHFNEGHAVLAGIELISEKMEAGMSFEEAWEKTKDEIVFTTHTPVMAGNESHPRELFMHLGANRLLTSEQLALIGGSPFNMTVAGLRLSHVANGVSAMHATTARAMWQDIKDSAPILSITNGVHRGTWQNPDIYRAYLSKGDLWSEHQKAKLRLFEEVRRQTALSLDPDVLTIGFARRAAPYKRSDLIFQRPEVIEPLLNGGSLQIIFSGKAHPYDYAGKEIISTLVKYSKTHPGRVVFLENYNIDIAKLMVQGVDVWLNNPKRPLEASATSGMKAAMNGVINFSILDGWWPEACRHQINGWQIGGGYQGPEQNYYDLVSLYNVLIEEVLPTYYERKHQWVRMMEESIKMSEAFTAERMLYEYYNLLYYPSLTAINVKAKNLSVLQEV